MGGPNNIHADCYAMPCYPRAQYMERGFEGGCVLRDHIPLTCNADDYLRMAAVPKHKFASFRGFQGVVENEDGGCGPPQELPYPSRTYGYEPSQRLSRALCGAKAAEAVRF